MTSTLQAPSRPGASPSAGGLDRFFRLTERGTTVAREFRGGLTTFFAVAYIFLLNPIILGGAKDKFGHTLNFGQLSASTIFAAMLMTFLMGVGANMPLAVASGLGLNGVVAFTLAPVMSWQDAMGLVVIEGIIIVLLVLLKVRQAIMHAIPTEIRMAIAAGIGLFIAFIGLNDAGFSTPGVGVPVQLGTAGKLQGWPVFVFVIGLLIMFTLYGLKVRGAILGGIVITTIIAMIVNSAANVAGKQWGLIVPKWPHKVVATPDFGLFGHFSIAGAFSARVSIVTIIVFIFTLFLSDFFDLMGTIVGISGQAGLVRYDGSIPRLSTAMAIDGLSAVAGGMVSASSNTAFIESSAGVGEGARTGLASVFTSLFFCAALFLTPLYQVVPQQAATPALVLVAWLMLKPLLKLNLDDPLIALPVFLTAVIMPFTFSITNGVGAGIISFTVMNSVARLARRPAWRVGFIAWALTILFGIYFCLGPIEHVFRIKA